MTYKVDIQEERESQRQKLIGELIQSTYREKSKLKDKTFHLKLASVIAEYLKNRQEGIVQPETQSDDIGTFFGGSIVYIIRNFVRTRVEEDALIAQFLENIVSVAVCRIEADLIFQEISEPERFFDISSAVTHILGNSQS